MEYKVRSPYTRVRQVFKVPGESMVAASAGDDTDVNNIIERFHRTGVMPHSERRQLAQYLDVSSLQQDMTTILVKGEQAMQEAASALQPDPSSTSQVDTTPAEVEAPQPPAAPTPEEPTT